MPAPDDDLVLIASAGRVAAVPTVDPELREMAAAALERATEQIPDEQ
jgi:hypothetical protein